MSRHEHIVAYPGQGNGAPDRRGPGPLPFFVGLAMLLGFGVLYHAATAASGTTVVTCTGNRNVCTLTLNNFGLQPMHIDPDPIRVDGRLAQVSSSGIVQPFGNSTGDLFNQDGSGIYSLQTITYWEGPLLLSGTQDHMTYPEYIDTPK